VHLFKQYAVGDYDAAARMIPIIDYGPYFAGAPGALEGVAADVAHASENVGFFYALNHGVSDDTIERAFAASSRFHALPLEQKLALRLDDNNIGYLAINASVQGASAVQKATQPNQNESFFVTHDRGPDHPDVIAGKPLRGRNRWPPGLPGLRADMMTYFDALRAMCDRMLPPFAVALGLSPDYFAPYFANEAHANLRFLHYPPQDTVEDNTFGQAPHTDNSFMTALARSEVPGLAVRLPSGEWFAPPIIPGTFLINLGNIMRRLVERPLPVDAARRHQRIRQRPLFDRLFPQSQPGRGHRVRAHLHRRREAAALPAGRLPRPCSRILPGKLFSPEGSPLGS
jgi:isopenicillin N synthase-like dioxygenase